MSSATGGVVGGRPAAAARLDALLTEVDGTRETVQPVLVALGLALSADSAVLLIAQQGPAREVCWFRHGADPPGREPVVARARSTFDYLVGADPACLPPAPLPDREGSAKHVGLPVIWAGRALGVLQVVGERFSERDLSFLETVMRHLAAALEHRERDRELLARHAHLLARLEEAPAGHLVLSATGEVLELNAFAAGLLGVQRRIEPGCPSLPGILADEDRQLLRSHVDACLASSDGPTAGVHVTTLTRGTRRLQLSSRRGVGPRGEPVCVTVLVEVSAGEERELRLLASAASQLGSLDLAETMAGTCRLFVPALADLCVIDLIESGPVLNRRASAYHANPVHAARFVEVEERWGLLPNVAFATLEAIRHVSAQVIGVVTPRYYEVAAVDDDHLRALVALAIRSWIVVPLVHPQEGYAFGVVRLATTGIRSPLVDGDCGTVSTITRVAAVALSNARTHQRVKRASAQRKPPPMTSSTRR